MTTTPAATTAVQEPRVSDRELALHCREACHQDGWSPSYVDNLALDLRDARATIASQAEALAAKEAEIERLKDFEPDYHRSRAELMQHLEARIAAEAALKTVNAAAAKMRSDLFPGLVDRAVNEQCGGDATCGEIARIILEISGMTAALSPPTKES